LSGVAPFHRDQRGFYNNNGDHDDHDDNDNDDDDGLVFPFWRSLPS
jgi:hypothetical protein